MIHNKIITIIDFYQVEDLNVCCLHFIGRELQLCVGGGIRYHQIAHPLSLGQTGNQTYLLLTCS